MDYTAFYQAEVDYRRERLSRDWMPIRHRRRHKGLRNEIRADRVDPAA